MAEMIKIESNIPMPARNISNASKYPWASMEVGDSFLVPRVNDEPIQMTRERANKAMVYAKRKTDRKYCSRTTDSGTRVWRIE